MSERGNLIVLSGPSGAGKSTVVGKAMEGRNDICFSVSVTTRNPRPGEIDGVNYFFIDRRRYDEMVVNEELLEHAIYVNNGYGTPRKFVEEKLNAGMNVILDIEIQGARQVMEKMPEAIKIFMIPPTLEELERRLTDRGTETAEVIAGRMARARQEYAEADFYDYIIVNADVDTAAAELSAILMAEKCKAAKRVQFLNV